MSALKIDGFSPEALHLKGHPLQRASGWLDEVVYIPIPLKYSHGSVGLRHRDYGYARSYPSRTHACHISDVCAVKAERVLGAQVDVS